MASLKVRLAKSALPLRPRFAPAATRRYATGSEPPDRPAKPPMVERRRAEPARPEPSFAGQVQGSIQARLRREREQREQYERWRELKDPSRNWMVTFFFVSGLGIAYYLGTFWPRERDPSSTLPLSKARGPRHNTKLENMQAAWYDFIEIVGKDNVSTLDDDVERHRTSSWSSHQPQPDEKPFCVVYPASTDEVSRLLKVCHKRRIPVVGYSGGTSLEGHYVQTRKGISIDFGRMDKVLALHKEDMDVVVQPAVGWESLNDLLADDGLFFPPDPGRGAMIGGMVGTGCSGTNAFRYGTIREWVLSLTVVLADGTVIKTRQRPRKSSAGYDLTKLFIGSEGTLGLVTEAVLKVTVKPQATSVAVCSFPSVHQAAACAASVVANGVPVAAVEILDDNQMRFTNAAGTTSRTWAEAPTLFFKFSGTAMGVKEQAAQVQALARKAGALTFEAARNQDEQEELWSARRSALWSTMAAGRESDKVWTGDVAVPMTYLPEIIEKTKEDLKSSGMTAGIVGHVGDGNFHSRILPCRLPLFSKTDAASALVCLLYSDAQRSKAEKVVHRMVKRAIEMEGTVTGEHGVGLVKRDYLPHELGETTVDAMRQIKLALDPLCLLNCDKVVRVEKPKSGLGASLHDVLTRLKAEPQRFPKLEVVYSPEQPVTEMVCVVLPQNGVRLRFDGPEQRLRLIEVTDFTKNHITFKDRDLLKPAAAAAAAVAAAANGGGSRSPPLGTQAVGPTFRHIYHRVLGPTYAGEFIPPGPGGGDGIYVLSYPGVAFNFALAEAAYSPDKDVVTLLAAASSQAATSMAVFSGDSWAEARPTLWTAPLPSVRLPSSVVGGGARSRDSYPDEVSLVRLRGSGGSIDMVRKWNGSGPVFRLQLGETTPQDLVMALGPPSAIYRKNDQKMVIHTMRAAADGARGGRSKAANAANADAGRPDDLTDTDQSSMNTGSDESDGEATGDGDDGEHDQGGGGSSGECFYNYFYLGFDVLLSRPTAGRSSSTGSNGIKNQHPDRLVATKLVLHGNIPGCYEFNRHRRCRWELRPDGPDSDDTAETTTAAAAAPLADSETEFKVIEERLARRCDGGGGAATRQRGMVLNRGWGDSPGSSCEFLGGWEESGGGRRAEVAGGDSTTTLYGFPGLVFEVLRNGYVNTVTCDRLAALASRRTTRPDREAAAGGRAAAPSSMRSAATVRGRTWGAATAARTAAAVRSSAAASGIGRAPSAAEARRKERESSTDAVGGEGSNINVVVRCRGRSEREVREGSPVVLRTDGVKGKVVELSTGAHALSNKTYSFDRVFSAAADQNMVFDDVVKPILDDMLAGYNCTIFAYGQTGTGKTYTMSGDMEETTLGMVSEEAGIIPRALQHLFNRLELGAGESCVKCSFIELYNEELRDLLAAEETRLKMFDDAARKTTVIQGMEERHIADAAQGLRVLRQGSVRRQVAATKCNDLSSRGHTVFTVTAYVKRGSDANGNNGGGGDDDVVAAGKLNLVDLAGSENIQRSGAEKLRAAEAGLINKSLLTLGRVINALVDGGAHIPYRESKLTRLLQDSLGGRTKTCIIATVSPARSNLEETMSTLDYAFRAKNIRNRPQLNAPLNKKMLLRDFAVEIERLKADLIATRQRNGVYLAVDAYDDMTAQSESRRIVVDEQAAKIETLESNLRNKVQDLFSMTSAFMGLRRDHDATRLQLDDARGLLERADIVLAATRASLAKETQRRRAHAETEERLAAVGGELVDTLRRTVDDVDGLHAKNRRRSDLQALNRVAWADGQARVADVTLAVERRLAEFRDAHLRHVTAIGDRLDGFVEAQLSGLDDARALLDGHVVALEDARRGERDQRLRAGDEADALLDAVADVRDSLKTHLAESLRAVSRAAEAISADVLHDMTAFHASVSSASFAWVNACFAKSRMNQLHDSYSSLGKDFKSIFDDLVRHMTAQRSEAESLRRQLQATAAAAALQNASAAARIQEALDEERRQAADDRQKLTAQVATLVAAQAESHEARLTERASLLHRAVTDCGASLEAAAAQHGRGMDAWDEREGRLLDEVRRSRDQLKAKLKDDWATAGEQSATMQAVARSVHAQTARVVDKQVDGLDEQMEMLDRLVARARADKVARHDEEAQTERARAQTVDQSLGGLATQLTTVTDRVRELGDEVDAAALADELGPLDDHVRGPLERLRLGFSTSALREYQPTGQTPRKVVYTFPTTLPRTELVEEEEEEEEDKGKGEGEDVVVEADEQQQDDDNDKNDNDEAVHRRRQQQPPPPPPRAPPAAHSPRGERQRRRALSLALDHGRYHHGVVCCRLGPRRRPVAQEADALVCSI
ncbi:hypothetical protein L249_0216 [Ophiocordyceps polyrhachis-furcata BCC 54312]|uniref:D-lactate dehydrogenase (cytochrome) n=1 Tax=Ophiocordyceps polyrhachis-furcata BCC 54312 TaxID=1330021 RepID=A0A367LD65_9HYPO|nr:hypothetical protein L249_0216 [Ophiocordyceps polyrhachis-furcata BCC 54312]